MGDINKAQNNLFDHLENTKKTNFIILGFPIKLTNF